MADDYDLLDSELSSVKGGMTEHEAFYAVLVAAVKADATTDDREAEELKALSHRTVALHELYEKDKNGFAEMETRIQGKFYGFTGDSLVQKALDVAAEASIPIKANKDMALSVYAHAVDIIFADSQVLEAEKRFLKALARDLTIPPQEAKNILHYLNLKNKF